MLSNLHTHTLFCDGQNTMEEMVLQAIALGFESLGFSSHSYIGLDPERYGKTITPETFDRYFSEIDRLQAKYADRIRLFRGLEIDSIRPIADSRLEYTIGSVHILNTPKGLRALDASAQMLKEAIDSYQGGVIELIEKYYTSIIEYARTSDYDITGHIDLPTKFNERVPLIPVDDPRYIDMALSAVDEVCAQGKIIEINTGAIARGYRTTPYPATFILRRILKHKTPIIITSDCHQASFLDCHFKESTALLKALGFTEQVHLTSQGFTAIPL